MVRGIEHSFYPELARLFGGALCCWFVFADRNGEKDMQRLFIRTRYELCFVLVVGCGASVCCVGWRLIRRVCGTCCICWMGSIRVGCRLLLGSVFSCSG